MSRRRSQAGQVASECLGVLLLVAVIFAAVIGTQLHTHVAVEVQRAICKIAGSSGCGEPGVPQAGASDEDKPREPDRSVYDDECRNELPGRLLRGEGDDPPASPRATRSKTTSARSSGTTPTRSAATPTTTPAPS